MSDKYCPLCGKHINDDELICSECNDNARKRNSIDFLLEEQALEDISEDKTEQDSHLQITDGQEEENSTISATEESDPSEEKQPEKAKKKINYKRIILIFGCLILCSALFSGAYILNKRKNDRHNAELQFWYVCIERNTPQGYSNYLQIYPNGKFHAEAQNKISELREKETQTWAKLKKSSDLNDFYAFLSVYPLTPFKAEARKIMDSLSWNIAQKENTAEAYLVYIQNSDLKNISGFYREIAQSKYDYLSKVKKVDSDEFNEIKDIVNTFFKTLSSHQFKKLTDLFSTPNVNNFYGARNRSTAMIIKSIEADMDRNKIKSLEYEPRFESVKIVKDSDGIYIVELTVTKKIAYKTNKASDNISEKLHIELTPQKKVRYFHTNRDSI